jgi:hypothetical protein
VACHGKSEYGEVSKKDKRATVCGSLALFPRELEDSLNYDLVINTEHLSFEDATSIIAIHSVPRKARP